MSAPVNAPGSWPNISSSSRFSFRAAQFIATNGLFFRGLFVCSALATSSLPVPFSPRIRTVARVGANALTPFDQLAHLRAVADQALEPEPLVELLAQLADRPQPAQLVRRLVDDRQQFVLGDRLEEVVRRPLLQRLDGRLHVARPADDHDQRVAVLLDQADDGQPVQVAHPQVGQDEVELFGLDLRRPLLAAGGDGARVAAGFEDLGDGLGVVPLVVDDQDAEPVLGRFGGCGFGLHDGFRTSAGGAAAARSAFYRAGHNLTRSADGRARGAQNRQIRNNGQVRRIRTPMGRTGEMPDPGERIP